MESIWSSTTQFKEYPTLQGDTKADVAVIGGGLAGILTAFLLKKHNIHAVVLEAAKIGSGQTQHTTAKITSQHDIMYSKLMKNFDAEKARQYASANQQAIESYRQIIRENQIDCSFEESPAYLYSQEEQDITVLEQEAKAAEEVGIRAYYTTETELPFQVAGAVKFENQARFHPLAFLKAIAENLEIYENTRAESVEENQIFTKRGTVTADHIVFATHYPFINAPGYYFARMHQERSYVLALENAGDMKGMYLGVDTDALSFRSWNGTLLLGGGGHRTGENSAGGKYTFLRDKAFHFYPKAKEAYHWSAQDCMTLDGVPCIGQFSASTPNWYVATGFQKWGMTTSMVAATLISDAITETDNSCASVFSPLRFTPSAYAKTFVADMGQAVKGLTKRLFSLPKEKVDELPAGHGGVVEYNDEKVGVYKDENQNLHIVSIQCPHLGCQLEWNPDEKSWDCPCHGSRFDYEGRILDNPAQTNLEKVEQGEE
jgi:glycine/D-amino acid oxidase-like deaminating enzyme/nitrite reductase/ring-hydroxylating ferredoxin subunit